VDFPKGAGNKNGVNFTQLFVAQDGVQVIGHEQTEKDKLFWVSG
jgi:hypothetical protein